MPKTKTWLDKGVENITRKPGYAEKIILKNMLPQKMSEVLLDFAKPLLDSIDLLNRLALESTLQMAIVVWNYSIMIDKPSGNPVDAAEKKSMEAMMTKAFGGPIGESVLKTLLDRKRSLYPDNKHSITDFDIKWDDCAGSYHIVVMSTD